LFLFFIFLLATLKLIGMVAMKIAEQDALKAQIPIRKMKDDAQQ